jgi:hypothetical protein
MWLNPQAVRSLHPQESVEHRWKHRQSIRARGGRHTGNTVVG